MRGNALFSVPQHYNVCSAVPEYLRSSSLQYCVRVSVCRPYGQGHANETLPLFFINSLPSRFLFCVFINASTWAN